ncbi:muscleblind-like protein 1, partial [Physella acuta]|uniref:muscleblind-like protein 1 n=1 Tax=Physella acuta TaxID=109671 RepID=UPI0027DE04EE
FLQGKCQRKDPPCKYLHPPQHLREQLLQNGRNNLILKNLQLQAYQQAQYGVLPVQTAVKQVSAGPKTVAVPAVLPGQYSYLAHSSQTHPQTILRPPTLQQATAATHSPYDATHYPGLQTISAVPAQASATSYNPFIATSLASVAMQTSADGTMSQALPPNLIPTTTKAIRADKFEGGEEPTRMWYAPWWLHQANSETTSENGESVTSHAPLVDTYSFPTYIPQVCREFQRGTCSRATSECRYAHPAEHIVVDATDNHVTVCMDFIKSKCTRDLCKYFHPPSHLQALVRAAHARNQASNNSNSQALQSAIPGMMPAYKRIAIGDMNKGGIPVYQSSQLMAPLQHTSLLQLQQPSYIPMSYTYVYPSDAGLSHMTPAMFAPPLTSLSPTLVPSTSPTVAPAVSSTVSTVSSQSSTLSSLPATSGLARLPTTPHNAYSVEYFGNNKQLLDTLPVCQDFKSGQCSSPYCKQVHLSEDYVEVNNGQVTVCRDYATRQTCKRSRCKYYHIPVELPPS